MCACDPDAPAAHALPMPPAFARVWITDRRGCARPVPDQVERLAAEGAVDAVVLREKDLDAAAYERLACATAAACARAGIAFVVHAHVDVARRLGVAAVHLPLPELRALGRPAGFACVGTNVHALDEVAEAQRLGADVLVASPVFAPSCKPAAMAQGLPFLRATVERARVPVLALGGIDDENELLIRESGAAGACRMADYTHR